MRVRRASKYELIEALRERYLGADRGAKGRLLDEVVAARDQ